MILMLIVSTITLAQETPKGMTLIPGFEDPIVRELDATVKYSTKENGTILISKNRIDMFELKSDTILPLGKELRVFLKLAECNDECLVIPAELIRYSVSVKQSFDDINENRLIVKKLYPNF
jgi:hypothetical protein